MKKILTTVIAILMVIPFQNLHAASDGDDTVIIIAPGNLPESPIPNRGLVPISAFFDSVTSSIVVSFLYDIGNAEIYIMNQFTGESYEDIINAYGTLAFIPISGSAGMYTISFELANGDTYYGEFVL